MEENAIRTFFVFDFGKIALDFYEVFFRAAEEKEKSFLL
jgi:hypothetical protein